MAFRLAPMAASSAVIQVPIFCPNKIKAALSKVTTPPAANACKMPTEAEEDWIMAVKIIPAKIPKIGFSNRVNSLINSVESLRGSIEALIISIPIKRIPNPATI